MGRYYRYKVAIIILSLVVVVETLVLIIHFWPTRPQKVPAPPAIGKIAIVIDDWGYNLHNLPIIKQIKYPLSISVLPNLIYSQVVAKTLHQKGFEIILHLPLEPYRQFRLEQNTIMTSMNETEIKNIIHKDLQVTRYAKGVSNHMGSKAVEDLKTMEIVFGELRKRKLYFLDSLSSPKSVCSGLAKEMHVGYARRDIFLDNEEEPNYIKGQIEQLKLKAKIYSYAIGVGHDRKLTLLVLKEMMPQLDKQGYKFVFVSELVK